MQVSAMIAIAGLGQPRGGLSARLFRCAAPLNFSPVALVIIAAQIEGWAKKALEFFNSGPPALLNNPRCHRRGVSFFHQTCIGGSYG